jgi:23S rRNA (adenine2030-N6)-methyltransferase
MNYRHIYHAGNFADVLKHAVLARIVTYLKGKEKAFRVIDTHAGLGLYDLSSAEAQKTGEWRDGIGRLLAADLPGDVRALLAPYLDAVAQFNGDGFADGRITRYPGSPVLARALFRPQDRLSAIELHPQDLRQLQAHFEGDYQARIMALDGWLALGAHVPPKEKRGLVLVDPPFEQPGEFDRLVDGLARATRRWPGGTYCLWYPLKHGARVDDFHRKLAGLGLAEVIGAELSVKTMAPDAGLAGTGLIVVNPPFTLAAELDRLLPLLRDTLAQDRNAGFRRFTIKPANASADGFPA